MSEAVEHPSPGDVPIADARLARDRVLAAMQAWFRVAASGAIDLALDVIYLRGDGFVIVTRPPRGEALAQAAQVLGALLPDDDPMALVAYDVDTLDELRAEIDRAADVPRPVGVGPLILFVDDSATMQICAEWTFRGSSWSFIGARTVDDAIAKARALRPALILADALMPGRGGYELFAELRRDPAFATVPMVVLCGNSQPYDPLRGVDGSLSKPWDTQVLLDKLDEFFHRGSVARAAAPPAPAAWPPPAAAAAVAAPRSATIMGMPSIKLPPKMGGAPSEKPAAPAPARLQQRTDSGFDDPPTIPGMPGAPMGRPPTMPSPSPREQSVLDRLNALAEAARDPRDDERVDVRGYPQAREPEPSFDAEEEETIGTGAPAEAEPSVEFRKRLRESEPLPPGVPPPPPAGQPGRIEPLDEIPGHHMAFDPNAPLYVDENVQFTIYRPKAVQPARWYPLLAFAHLAEKRGDEEQPDPVAEVQRQAQQVLGDDAARFADTTQDASAAVPAEGELTIVPELPGFDVNPRTRTFLWTETVHREEFRVRAPARLDGTVARGKVTVWLGSLILAEVPLAIRVAAATTNTEAQPAPASARPYRKIFASYSHQDAAIVDEVSRLARALGDEYVRDWVHLRSGEVWNDRLRKMISDADVFQLFWSRNSMRSRYCRDEWEYALSLGREAFVRPTYWEDPMPTDSALGLPPESLVRLHFQKIRWSSPPPIEPAAPPPAPAPETRRERDVSELRKRLGLGAGAPGQEAIGAPPPPAAMVPGAPPGDLPVFAGYSQSNPIVLQPRTRRRSPIPIAIALAVVVIALVVIFLLTRN